MLTYLTPGKLAATYPVQQTGQARAAFLFRRRSEFDYDHRDLDRQKQLLREVFADDGWEVPRLLADLGRGRGLLLRLDQPDRHGPLVRPAGHPGRRRRLLPRPRRRRRHQRRGHRRLPPRRPRSATAGGDHARAFDHYEHAMRELVVRSRRIGPDVMTTLIPATRRQVWLTIQAMRLVPRLPAAVQRRLFAFQGGPATALEAVTLPTWP